MSSKYKPYIVVAAVKGALPHRGFLECLKGYVRRLGGSKIYVCPMAGPDRDAVLDEEFQKSHYVIVDEVPLPLGPHLSIMSFDGRPEEVNPLCGIERHVANGMSHIVPSPKQYFQTVGRLVGHPEGLWTTGACTEPLYRPNKRGVQATHDHRIGAVVVEIGKDGLFYVRHVRWSQGGFTDLGTRAEVWGKSGGVRFRPVRAEALVTGDWHTGSTHDVIRNATYEMMHLYEPRFTVMHDIFDGASINHHEANNLIERSRLADQRRERLEDEVVAVARELRALSKHAPDDGKIVVTKGNHDEFLDRYLASSAYVRDPCNATYAHILWGVAQQGKDVLATAVLAKAKLPNVRFLRRRDSLKVAGWELAQHGDLGLNGAKLNTAQAVKITGGDSSAVVGHHHTPQQFRNVIVVGCSARAEDMSYARRNPSTWMHANALVWPDGTAQLVVLLQARAGAWTYT